MGTLYQPALYQCLCGREQRLTRAAKVLERLTGQAPAFSQARYTVRSYGIRRNEKITVCCTVCEAKAEETLEKELKAWECELWRNNFSDAGNIGLGIQEHTDLGIKYDLSIGSCHGLLLRGSGKARLQHQTQAQGRLDWIQAQDQQQKPHPGSRSVLGPSVLETQENK